MFASRILMTTVLAASACCRGDKPAPAPTSDLVVQAHAEKTATGLTLTLSAGPPDLGMDDITYARAETLGLVVRANGSRVQPTGETFHGTLNGGEVLVTLPAIPGASKLTIEGSLVVRNVDGTELERAPVPATVEIR